MKIIYPGKNNDWSKIAMTIHLPTSG